MVDDRRRTPLDALARTELRRPFDRLQIERKVESPPDKFIVSGSHQVYAAAPVSPASAL